MAVEHYPRKPVTRPSTVIKTDTSALTGSASDSEKVVMLVGSAGGGRPNTPYRVRNIIQAQEIFRSGELLDALELAWNPSNTSVGAGTVIAMRVEDAKAAESKKTGATFRSKLYGAESNDIEIELQEIKINEKVNRTLTVGFSPDNYKGVYRNIGEIINISKEDGSSLESLSVEVTDTELKIYTKESGAEAVEVVETFNLGLGSTKYANVLANSINSIKGVSATMPTSSNKNINTVGLDPMVKTEVTTKPVTVTAVLADIHNQLRYDEYVEVVVDEEYISSEHSSEDYVVVLGGAKLKDFSRENLRGGTEGDVPVTWGDKFRELANQGGYYLVPLTDNAAIHAEATAFVNERTANEEPMRVITGAGYDETPAQLLGRAGAIRDGKTMIVGFSGKSTLDDGRTVKTPGYMHAAQVAGIASGLPIGEAVTFKDIRLTDLSRVYDSEQMDMLNSGGIVMAEFVRNNENTNFRIVDDVTTYNDPTDPVKNQMGVGEGSDFLVSEMKVMLDDKYIGTSVVNMSASLIKSGIQSFLDSKKRANEIQDFSPEDIQVVINGEVANISVVVHPIRSLKRIEVGLVYRQQIIRA